MRCIFIFIDGIGIGKPDDTNPFYMAEAEVLRLWEKSGNGTPHMVLDTIDPLMGVEGIPQSATGQTSIFTGINIPALIGKHTGSFPNKQMRKLIREENLLKKLHGEGVSAKFINAYPRHSELFSNDHVKIAEDGNLLFSDEFPEGYKKRISVTSSMIISNHCRPYDIEDIISGRSLYQDFSNRSLLRYGLGLPVLSPEKAAETIFNVSGEYDFVLYEYFQTDVFGHRKSVEEQIDLIRDLDKMIITLINMLDPDIDTLIMTSDHGNLEDRSVRSHTLNPVPLITWGRNNHIFQDEVKDIAGIAPVLIRFMTS